MQISHINLHEEVITDDQGRKKVILDYDEYETLLSMAGQASEKKKDFDFHTLHGLALKAPLNPHPRFQTEDDLWKDDV